MIIRILLIVVKAIGFYKKLNIVNYLTITRVKEVCRKKI